MTWGDFRPEFYYWSDHLGWIPKNDSYDCTGCQEWKSLKEEIAYLKGEIKRLDEIVRMMGYLGEDE